LGAAARLVGSGTDGGGVLDGLPALRLRGDEERPERTARGHRRFRCGDCGHQFNKRSGGLLNRAQHPSDVIELVVPWRLRCRRTLRDLSEMLLLRGIVFSHEAVRDWEAGAR
jgi:hypothetical protein